MAASWAQPPPPPPSDIDEEEEAYRIGIENAHSQESSNSQPPPRWQPENLLGGLTMLTMSEKEAQRHNNQEELNAKRISNEDSPISKISSDKPSSSNSLQIFNRSNSTPIEFVQRFVCK
ncbi:unnamed protein product [Dovyalis caffra]|uniref:Uncharacterized protein n=1 Tax=Dovyalis caffra TaxID=77055 RepID=A0AAV1SHE1_9ROSI|nr:unnamed protein product [Dovyalis caffra]